MSAIRRAKPVISEVSGRITWGSVTMIRLFFDAGVRLRLGSSSQRLSSVDLRSGMAQLKTQSGFQLAMVGLSTR